MRNKEKIEKIIDRLMFAAFLIFSIVLFAYSTAVTIDTCQKQKQLAKEKVQYVKDAYVTHQ